MRRILFAVPALAVVALACQEGNPENRAACGIAVIGAANKVLDQLRTGTSVLSEAPPELRGTVPARVPGHGTSPSLVGESPDGPIVAYDGEGFPARPGFGVILVEDSTDTFQGVLIYDLDPPMGFPVLGGVSNGQYVIPLFGLRVPWGAISTPRCPLFAKIDSTKS
jgi:hypothetical protein